MRLRVAVFGSVFAFLRVVNAAEDHSQHQHGPTRIDEHAEHKVAPAIDESGHHEHQSTDAHEHAHHQPLANEPTESERAHVPPEPPQLILGEMTNERMIELMQMEDDAPVGMLLFDQFEWRVMDGEDAQALEFEAWYGGDYNKLWVKADAERVDREEEGSVELLWDRIISPWWSAQAGVRQDFSEGPSRTWASVGVQGLAPYFFEIEAVLYLGEEGRTAARFAAEYDLLITQRLVLQPEIELEWYGKDDVRNGVGSGLSEIDIGLRLRYEIVREFAPYIGIQWARKFGDTARYARSLGFERSDVMAVIGLRGWF